MSLPPEPSTDATIRAAIIEAVNRLEGEPLRLLYQRVVAFTSNDGVSVCGASLNIPEVERRARILSNRAIALFSPEHRRLMVECPHCRKLKFPGNAFVRHLRRQHPAQLLEMPAERFQ